MAEHNRKSAITRIVSFLHWAQEQGDVFTAAQAARLTGRSPRTVYRHIQALKQMGHRIDGEAGIGFMYRRK